MWCIYTMEYSVQFSPSVVSDSFRPPWTAACQATLSITNSWSLLKLTSIESVTLSNHLILCRPLLLQPSIFPSIKVFSSESVLRVRWPKYWNFSFNISSSSEYSGTGHMCCCGDGSGAAAQGNSFLKRETTVWPTVTLLGIHPRETKTSIHTKAPTWVFAAE